MVLSTDNCSPQPTTSASLFTMGFNSMTLFYISTYVLTMLILFCCILVGDEHYRQSAEASNHWLWSAKITTMGSYRWGNLIEWLWQHIQVVVLTDQLCKPAFLLNREMHGLVVLPYIKIIQKINLTQKPFDSTIWFTEKSSENLICGV